MDLIDRQAAIDAVTYAMRNGGDWRPALESVPSVPALPELNFEPQIDCIAYEPHDAAWWKAHHEMGFESPIYDLFKALGVYDGEEDDDNGQL